MKILLLSSSYNSLTQRAHVELAECGHEVSIELALNESVVREGIDLFNPDLVLCPMLKFIIPKDIWRKTPCIIVHPGIKGDRGASSIDWAIMEDEPNGGVTAVQAADEVDSGLIWATSNFSMRPGSKSSLYRDELTHCAIKVIHLTVRRFENRMYVPEPLDYSRQDVTGRFRQVMKQSQRVINWQKDTVEQILRKSRSADSNPGVLDTINGKKYYIYGAHREGSLVGSPGRILATRHGAICRAAVDGAVWITHLRAKSSDNEVSFKLPATMVLANELNNVLECRIPLLYAGTVETYKDIWYREHDKVVYLYFEFYNGAMSTTQCERLNEAFTEVCKRPNINVIVLMGGRDFWSNGIHLNVIEAAENSADESWRNINAINEFVRSVIDNTSHLVISAMHGSAGAGGVMMALAADKVIAREGIILNPHYKSMGGLFGSEYWTYLLPRKVGKRLAAELTNACLPIGSRKAKEIGLVDDVIYPDELNFSSFHDQIIRIAEQQAHDKGLQQFLINKKETLQKQNEFKALDEYRDTELEKMQVNFYGNDNSYHLARSRFVKKMPLLETPDYLAVHRCAISSGDN